MVPMEIRGFLSAQRKEDVKPGWQLQMTPFFDSLERKCGSFVVQRERQNMMALDNARHM